MGPAGCDLKTRTHLGGSGGNKKQNSESKKQPWHKQLYALGILHIGEANAIAISKVPSQTESSLRSTQQDDVKVIADEDPFNLKDSSTTFLGLIIAILTVVTPLAAVLIERPHAEESIVPTDQERYGSKTSFSLSLSRVS